MADIDETEDGIKITRSYYKALAFFGFFVVLFLCRQIIAWDGNKGLITPIIFFIFFIAYNLNCIDIFIVNNSKIRLMGKYEIEYSVLKKVRRVANFRRGAPLYYIVYLDMNSKKRIKFFYLSYKNAKYYFLLKKIIGDS